MLPLYLKLCPWKKDKAGHPQANQNGQGGKHAQKKEKKEKEQKRRLVQSSLCFDEDSKTSLNSTCLHHGLITVENPSQAAMTCNGTDRRVTYLVIA